MFLFKVAAYVTETAIFLALGLSVRARLAVGTF
jgi:hypothetical protein